MLKAKNFLGEPSLLTIRHSKRLEDKSSCDTMVQNQKTRILRGGIIIKNGKIADFFPNRGGETKQKSLKFKFGHLKTNGGGLNFSKMSEL